MSARWVHAGNGKAESTPFGRSSDRIPHGAPPGHPTSHTRHTGHGAWFCRITGGMPHTLTRNAIFSLFSVDPDAASRSALPRGVAPSSAPSAADSAAASAPSAPSSAPSSAASAPSSPFTALGVSSETRGTVARPLHPAAPRRDSPVGAASRVALLSALELGMSDRIQSGVALASALAGIGATNVPAPSHGARAVPAMPASHADASTPAPRPRRSAAGANPHAPPSLTAATALAASPSAENTPGTPPLAPTTAAHAPAAPSVSAATASHRPRRVFVSSGAASSRRPEVETTRLSGSTDATPRSSVAAMRTELAARSGTRSAALIVRRGDTTRPRAL